MPSAMPVAALAMARWPSSRAPRCCVGSVGRTDLLGPEHARPYALDMHRSLHQTLLRQPYEAVILPTHGAGSRRSRSVGEAWSSRSASSA